MTTIGLVADDQSLEVAVNPVITSGEENTVILHVDFSEDWNGFGKNAVFFTEKNKNTLYEKIMSGGECIVPSEVMVNEGTFLVGIRGVNSTSKQVKTTSLVKYKISKGTPAVEEFGPTPDVYEQLLSAYGKADSSIDKLNSDIEIERARIDNLSTLTEGSTTADAELLDIRVKADGSTATSAGNAVREQITELKGDIVTYTSNYDNGIKRIDDEWIYGSIESDGSIYPYNDRITCKNFHVADRTIPIHIDEEFQIIYVEYNSDLTVKHRYANHRTDFEITKGIIFRLSIYRRTSISGEKASIPLFSYKVTTNTNTIYEIDRLKKFENVFITVNPTATKSEFVYQKFSDGLAKAMEYENATLYVKAHTYDILSELGGSDYTENYHASSENSGIGLRIGKGVKIIAEENAILVAEYNGTNRDFGFNFSILNVIGSFELNGITLRARNIRYCVHEDVPVIDSTVDSYTAIYKNCKMYHFANNEYGYSGVYCIGAGVYNNSITEIENCYFYADGEYSDYPVEYHNYATTNVEHSTVIIKDNYFVGEKGLRFYGFSPDGSIIDAFVSNNKIGRDVAINGTTNRINLRKWNNTIDTN